MSRSGKFALFIAILYAILLAWAWFGGMVGHILYVGLLSTTFWAVYVAGPLATILWVGLMFHRLTVGKNRRAIFSAGLKSAVIIFGGIGLVLWTVATTPPSARTFSSGYWIHAKIWVDIDEIRTWARNQPPSVNRFEPIPRNQWPASLRRVAISGGTVTCDPKTLTVIFYEGGQYGHWGLTTAPAGTSPPDDRHAIQLQDGAWVWCE